MHSLGLKLNGWRGGVSQARRLEMQLERERAEQRALQQRLEQHAAAEQRAAARAEMEALRAAEDQARSLDQEELGADPTLLFWRGLRKVFDLNLPSLAEGRAWFGSVVM